MIEFRDPSVPLSPDQLELRKQVFKQVTAEPGSFDMTMWELTRDWSDEDLAEAGICRTVRCVAGWAQFLACGEVDERGIEQEAVTLLGLTHDEYDPLDLGACEYGELFYTEEADAVERLARLAGEE